MAHVLQDTPLLAYYKGHQITHSCLNPKITAFICGKRSTDSQSSCQLPFPHGHNALQLTGVGLAGIVPGNMAQTGRDVEQGRRWLNLTHLPYFTVGLVPSIPMDQATVWQFVDLAAHLTDQYNKLGSRFHWALSESAANDAYHERCSLHHSVVGYPAWTLTKISNYKVKYNVHWHWWCQHQRGVVLNFVCSLHKNLLIRVLRNMNKDCSLHSH